MIAHVDTTDLLSNWLNYNGSFGDRCFHRGGYGHELIGKNRYSLSNHLYNIGIESFLQKPPNLMYRCPCPEPARDVG